MSIRCSLVLMPIGIGTPPALELDDLDLAGDSAVRARFVACRLRPSRLLVTRISAWSSGMSSATRSETSGPIRPIFSVRSSRRAAERDDVALLQHERRQVRSQRRRRPRATIDDAVLGMLRAGIWHALAHPASFSSR